MAAATPREIALMTRDERRSYYAKRKLEKAVRGLIAAFNRFHTAKSRVRVEWSGCGIDERRAVLREVIGADFSGTDVEAVIDSVQC